jgi:hypothetical protein
MKILADTRVHIYPCHDKARLFRSLLANLDTLAPCHLMAMFLTERSGHDVFNELANLSGGHVGTGLEVAPTGEPECLALFQNDWPVLCIYAGRHIITEEGLDILALTLRGSVQDGMPADQTIARILRLGAVPVLAWSPGRWTGLRARHVKRLLQCCEPGELLVGDSALRTTYLPRPRLLRYARGRGFGMVSGSDLLSYPGDEILAGVYGSRIECEFRHTEPVTSLREGLRDPETRIRNVSCPMGPFTVLKRRIRARMAVRKSG